MDISFRLKTIASLVPKNSIVADIGTDHSYIPIYLIKNNLVKKVIACDINKGPLLSAEKNISNNNMSDKIETRLGSGFSKINVGEVDCAIIAGMGGKLIIDIINENLSVAKSLKYLILQPQRDIDEVRKFAHSIGKKIVQETMLVDDGRYYTIICMENGEDIEYNEVEYIFGKKLLDEKNVVLKNYIQMKIENNKKLVEKIQENKNQVSEASADLQCKIDEYKGDIKKYKEVLACL